MKTSVHGSVLAAAVVYGLLTFRPHVHAQGGLPLWTNVYASTGNSGDYPKAVAVDATGNVFVTGYSLNQSSFTSSSYATVAYSSAGVASWTNLHNGSANDYSRASAIAVDSSGNVVVTGNSYNGEGNNYFDTIKYSGAGVPLWTNRYPAPDSTAGPCAVAVDSSDNVFMAAISGMAAYSSGGAVLWTNNDASAYAVAVDSTGNVLIIGPAGTSKYSGAGVALWSNPYVYGLAKPIAVDRNSNVYVTGYSLTGTNYFFATIAYSGAGVPLWTNNFNRPGGSDDRAVAIAVDNSGNVFVTGKSARVYNSSLFSDFKYATVAYSSVGTPLWTNLYSNGFGDIPAAIASDTSGNMFVTGTSQGNSGSGYATVSYSNAGVPLWTNRYDAMPGPADATAITVDRSGNVFVAGQANVVPPYGLPHFVTIKYNSTVPPTLNIQNVNSGFVLTWTPPGWSLQFAPTAASTFTNISGATSPYTNSVHGSEGYFRLQVP
jgi:hypothetical protein